MLFLTISISASEKESILSGILFFASFGTSGAVKDKADTGKDNNRMQIIVRTKYFI